MVQKVVLALPVALISQAAHEGLQLTQRPLRRQAAGFEVACEVCRRTEIDEEEEEEEKIELVWLLGMEQFAYLFVLLFILSSVCSIIYYSFICSLICGLRGLTKNGERGGGKKMC